VATTSLLDYTTDNCSIAATLALVGEKWSLLVLREAFNGVRRFDDLHDRIGAPRQVLSARLARLVDEGVLRRVPYREPGQRQRYEYRLTDKGLDLYPILVALMTWGDRWAGDPAGPAITLHHRDCGAAVRLALRCDDGHELGGPREVRARPGAGARPRSA
jgi:DNA-binding HxlR family transcriptional regulator